MYDPNKQDSKKTKHSCEVKQRPNVIGKNKNKMVHKASVPTHVHVNRQHKDTKTCELLRSADM